MEQLYMMVDETLGNTSDLDTLEGWKAAIEATCIDNGWTAPQWQHRGDGSVADANTGRTVLEPVDED